MPRFILVAPLCAAVLAGCSSSVARLHQPDRIDAFCADRVPLVTAIESIVSSTDDAPEPVPLPSRAQIHKLVADQGGVIAHWNDQPLLLPNVAKSLGATGQYVALGDAAISDGSAGSDSRRIFLTLHTAAGPKTLALRAYDVQDVCNEGKLKS